MLKIGAISVRERFEEDLTAKVQKLHRVKLKYNLLIKQNLSGCTVASGSGCCRL